MPRHAGKTDHIIYLLRQILHCLWHFYMRENKITHSVFLDIAQWMTDYTRDHITTITNKYQCDEDCFGKMDLEPEKEVHISEGDQALMDSANHVLEERAQPPSVHQFVREVNAHQQDTSATPIVMTTRRAYKILDKIGYSSKLISSVLGVYSEDTRKKRIEDMKRLSREIKQHPDIHTYVFADESSLNLATLYDNTRAISKKGERAYGHARNFTTKDNNDVLSMIVFLTLDQNVKVVFLDRANTKVSFEEAARECIREYNMEHMHFLVDNGPAHRREQMKIITETEHGTSFSHLPRYSPDTNAGEYVHHIIKTAIRTQLEDMEDFTGEEAKKVARDICAHFHLDQDVRAHMIQHSMNVIGAVVDHDYEEAVKMTKKPGLNNR